MASIDKEVEESLYEKYIEGHRCVIINAIDTVRCYFDKLRDMRVLTFDDIEEINNKNPTRRFKAGHFLDILQTKGNHGVQCFMNILEFQNPETFQTVAKRKPRPPPPGFVKSVDPLDLHVLDRIPETIRVLHDEVKGNTDLKLKVQELEQGLKANQNDKDELQVENDRLRIENIALKAEKEELAKKCGDLVKQNVTLREQSMEYLRNSLEFSRERDLQRERCTAALTQKNELERQVLELKEMMSQGQQTVSTCPQNSSTSGDEPDQEHISLEKALERLTVEKQILKEELEDQCQNCEDIVSRMNETSVQLHETQSKCQELEKKVKTLTKERNNAQQTYQERKEKVETYFLKIQQLEEEKRTLEEERIQEQKKWHKESSDRLELFREKHKLENAYEELKIKYDLLARCSTQISLLENIVQQNGQQQIDEIDIIADVKYNTLPTNISGIPNCSSLPLNAGSAFSHRLSQHYKRFQRGSGPNESFNSIEKARPESTESVLVNVPDSLKRRGEAPRDSEILEENCVPDPSAVPYYVSKSIQGSDKGSVGVSSVDSINKKDTTSETSDESNSAADDYELVQYEVMHTMVPRHPVFNTNSETQPFIVTLGTPSLTEQIEVTGGNFTGIFIDKVLKKPAEQSLKVGDQILSVMKVCNNGERITKYFNYCTLEEVYKVLEAEANVVSVELKCIRDPSAFKKVIQWMVDNNSCGDFFFTRSNFKCFGEEGEHPVQSGDVYCVLDTKSRPKTWRVTCYDRDVQAWQTEPVYIPNQNQALRGHVMKARQKSDSNEKNLSFPGRKGGIRCRSENYTKVLPVKAISKSQVLLFGADEIVTMVQTMMAADQSRLPVEILGENDLDVLKHFPQDKSDAHRLRKGSLTPVERNQSIRIILYLCVHNTGTAQQLRAIFGDEFVLNEDKPDTVLEGHLQSLGLNYDVIHIPNDEIVDRASLVQFLQERISQLQNQVYWLGAQNLSVMDIEQYQFILGHQLNVNDTQTQGSVNTNPLFLRSKSQC